MTSGKLNRLYRELFAYRWTAIGNFLIALGITVFNDRFHNPTFFANNLLISFCIGTIAYAMIRFGVWHFWRERPEPPRAGLGLLIMVSCGCALPLGLALSATLLGFPLGLVAINVKDHSSMYLVVMSLTGGCAFLVIFIRSKMEALRTGIAQEKLRAEANARRVAQAQLQLLQAQIEPHMLFNTLANVQGLISFDPPRAAQMLDQLILYLRASLQAARAERTTLGQEFAMLRAYLNLMQVRMGTRLQFELDLPAELEQISIPPMLLQPLLENAIKHGVEPKPEGGSIVMRAQRQGDSLLLQVIDTGMGLDAPAQPGTRLGVANTRERIHALFGEQAKLRLLPNQPQGCIAELSLPFHR